jgi:hypothetical protein
VIDPKKFVDDMYQPVATPSELQTALEYAGFTEILIEFHPDYQPRHQKPPREDDGYWAVICYREGTLESVRRDVLAILSEFYLHPEGDIGLYEWTPEKRMLRGMTINLPGYALEHPEVSESIVSTLLETDATASMPRQRAEIKILPAHGLEHHHDIVLISDHAPLYVGTIAPKHSVWRVVKTAPNVGRAMRAQLGGHSPTKEECAIRMVEIMRPYWKPLIAKHGFLGMFENEEEHRANPKEMAMAIEPDVPRYHEIQFKLNGQAYEQVVRTFFPRPRGQFDERGPACTPDQIIQQAKDTRQLPQEATACRIVRNSNEQSWRVYGIRESEDAHYVLSLLNQMESVIQPDAALVQKIAEIIEDGLKQHGIQRGTVPDTDTAEAYIRQTNAALRKYRAVIDGVHKGAAGNYGGGWIYIRPNSSILCEPNELRRVIAHELVHRTQDERSKGKGLGGHHDHYSHSEAMAYARDAAETMREAGLSAADVNRVTATSNPRLFRIFKFYRLNREWWRIFLEYLARYLRPVSECLESAAEEIAKEAAQAEKPASPEQAEAGNYRKGHVNVQGLEIAIENAKGSTRSGVNKAGEAWKVALPAHYGYIKGTEGKDKDHLDVYIGDNPGGMLVFVVNQQREEGGFDEHKIMLGFASKDEAIDAYDRAFTGDLGPKLRESVMSTTVHKLKDWLKSGNTKKPFENIAEAVVESLLESDELSAQESA